MLRELRQLLKKKNLYLHKESDKIYGIKISLLGSIQDRLASETSVEKSTEVFYGK